jgi:chromosome partitioning protein
MRTLAVINQKGGVGKTTTACNLAAALVRRGLRVLAVDLDPQAHLSLHLDHDVHSGKASLYEVLVKGMAAGEAIVDVAPEGLSLLPGTIDLSSAELELAGEIGRESILRTALAGAELEGRFDLAIVDCPPSLGLLALNGLTAASEVLIPLQAEFFSLHGIGRLLDVIQVVRTRLRKGPEVLGIVLCRYQKTTRLSREVLEELRTHFGAKLLETVIHQNVRLAEASSHGQPIFAYDESSKGARDYAALAQELLQRWGRDFPEAALAARSA